MVSGACWTSWIAFVPHAPFPLRLTRSSIWRSVSLGVSQPVDTPSSVIPLVRTAPPMRRPRQTDINFTFKAGASYFSTTNLAALVHASHKLESHYVFELMGAQPDEPGMADVYRRCSPLFHTDNIAMPLLVRAHLRVFFIWTRPTDSRCCTCRCSRARRILSCRRNGRRKWYMPSWLTAARAVSSTRLTREKATDSVARTRISLRWKRRRRGLRDGWASRSECRMKQCVSLRLLIDWYFKGSGRQLRFNSLALLAKPMTYICHE